MSKRDFILVASTAAITSLLTWFAATSLTTKPDGPRPESRAASAEPVPVPSQSYDHAFPANPVRATAMPADAARQGSSTPVAGTPRDPTLAFKKQREVGEQMSGFMARQGTADPAAIYARIEARFYAEDLNQEWAGSAEQGIRTLFESNEGLDGMAPLQVACRSKNCQVVLSAPNRDPEQVRLMSEKFMRAATRGDVGMKDKVVSYFPDASMGRVVFYLSENGNMDLFQ